jgi:hypothetical protein
MSPVELACYEKRNCVRFGNLGRVSETGQAAADEAVAEYYEVLERLNVDERRVEHLYDLLQRAGIVTHVNLGARYAISRDPDDNVLLATAAAGQARFLITNEHDLLDIPSVVYLCVGLLMVFGVRAYLSGKPVAAPAGEKIDDKLNLWPFHPGRKMESHNPYIDCRFGLMA